MFATQYVASRMIVDLESSNAVESNLVTGARDLISSAIPLSRGWIRHFDTGQWKAMSVFTFRIFDPSDFPLLTKQADRVDGYRKPHTRMVKSESPRRHHLEALTLS